MKHNTPGLIKFKKLQRALGFSRVRETVGLLEQLWILAARESPRGDIGRLDDEMIAIELEWDDEPSLLIEALVKENWIERHPDPEVRLLVHDWKDHAPRFVHGIASKKGGFIQSMTVVDDYSPQLQSESNGSIVDDPCAGALPNLTIPNQTKIDPTDLYHTPDEASVAWSSSGDTSGIEFPTKVSSCSQATTWVLTKQTIAEYQRRFPAVDVPTQAQRALDWLLDVPSRKKTAGGMKKFLTTWFQGAKPNGRGSPQKTFGQRNGAYGDSNDSDHKIGSF